MFYKLRSEYFTVEEANKELPEVSKLFNRILNLKNHIVLLQEEIQKINDTNDSPYFTKFLAKKKELNKAVTNLYQAIENLEEKGVLIKSVDEGLVDFPSLMIDKEVWLCWKVGESSIRFWHGKDEGFSGRKPVPVKGFSHKADDLSDLR